MDKELMIVRELENIKWNYCHSLYPLCAGATIDGKRIDGCMKTLEWCSFNLDKKDNIPLNTYKCRNKDCNFLKETGEARIGYLTNEQKGYKDEISKHIQRCFLKITDNLNNGSFISKLTNIIND